ncbi:hypothetical protein [Aliarcobacter butzleri]|uniref:hypothetical protein n=1 Tax=Aliarcobacter butzleri TaxID=28197 RepID=UPI00126A39EB|nr:hypothetical protein [Aliarcobacter butzleri]
MFVFFKQKPLSEYTDDEIKKELSFIPVGASQIDINNLMGEARKRGIRFKILDIGTSKVKKEQVMTIEEVVQMLEDCKVKGLI